MKDAILSLVYPHINIPLVGLDISDRSAKFLKFGTSRKKQTVIDTFGEFDIPEGLIAKGEITDEPALTSVFAAWMTKEKRHLKGCYFVISLPEEKSFVRLIEIPHVKPEEVANAIRWELENQIPMPVDEVIFDYEIMTSAAAGQKILNAQMTAFPKDVIASYLRTLKGASIAPCALELESQAVVRACIANEDDMSSHIFVDIGRTRSSIIAYSNGFITYTTTINIGGALFEDHIAKTLNVSTDEATRIKKNVGLNKKLNGGKVFEALKK